MFSARTPHARLTTISLVLLGALLIASPVFARHHHHDDGDSSSKTSHDSAASHASHPAAKPVAKTPAAPAAAPSVKAAPAPSPSVSPLDMTRDGGNRNAETAGSGVRAADAGRLNPAGQIVRMGGALIAVLLLILGIAHLFRRSPMMAQMAANSGASSDLSFQGTLKAAFSFLSAKSALALLKRNGPQSPAMAQAAVAPAEPPAPLDAGLLRLSGAQVLPGSASSVHLVQVGTKGMLLGTSADGPIQVLGEFEGLEAVPMSADTARTFGSLAVEEAQSVSPRDYSESSPYLASDFETLLREQDEDAAFDELLREQSPPAPERGETLVVQSVLERLHQTRDRLSRRLNDGTIPGEDRFTA